MAGQQTNTKVLIKMQLIARMRMVGITDGIIAEKLGISRSGLSQILVLPQYKDIENGIMQGTFSKMDEQLAGNTEALLASARQMVPLAQRALLDAVVQRRDQKLSVIAAQEILDRDPDRTLVKASRAADREQVGGSSAISLPAALLANLRSDSESAAKEIKGTQTTAKSEGPTILQPPSRTIN